MGSPSLNSAEIALLLRTHRHHHQCHHAQESQHLRLLLPLRHPAVQGGLWHHGRCQGRTSVLFRPRRRLRRLRQEHRWWRGTGYARRGGRTHELHPDGHPLRLQDGRQDRCRRLQALPHDLRCQVLRQRSRRRLRGDEDWRGHDRRRPPEGPDGVKVNIFRCFLIKASRTELSGTHTKKAPLHLMILLLGSTPRRVETHIHSVKNHHRHHQSEILHWDQLRFIESLQQIWKPKIRNPTIQIQTFLLEIALKLRKMPSLKLNYSSSAFSRALLHNKKVRTRYFGDETSEIPYTPCPGSWEGLGWINFLANPQKHFVPTHKHPNQPKGSPGLRKASLERSLVQFWARA